MLRHCAIVIFLAFVPQVHLFKTNSSITLYFLVDDLSDYIKSELKQNVSWPAGNHFIGPAHRFAIHERYCGDFSTLKIIGDPRINNTYNKHLDMMVYQCDVALGLGSLYFGFVLDLNLIGQNWESSKVKIKAHENVWDISFEVWVRRDGYCRIQFLDGKILHLDNYNVDIEPQNHIIRRWIVWILTRSFVWSYFDTWNEMLKGTVRVEFRTPQLNELICKAFMFDEKP